MSILIKGMEMPEIPDYNGINCCLYKTLGGVLRLRMNNEGVWFDVVPVPPHGRLIDADKQDAQIETLIERYLHGYTKSTWDFVCELRYILKRNPTIIPAEEGET